MGRIYLNSICNIAAEAGAHCQAGLFPKDSRALKTCKIEDVQIPDLPNASYVGIPRDYASNSVQDSPLRRRGWVCQERLLAPRQLSFAASEVFWTCSDLSASETFPNGYLHQPHDQELRDCQFAETFQGHISDCKRPHTSDETYYYPLRLIIRQQSDVLPTWRNAVSIYTKSFLTREDDKLVAIQGLVKEFAPLIHDQNIAGLWRGNFWDELLWEVVDGTQANGEPAFRSHNYRAPSWAWTSIEGKVCWQRLVNSLPYKPAAEFLEVNVTPVVKDAVAKGAEMEKDSTGQVSDGYIRVLGRLTSTKTFYWYSINDCSVNAWWWSGLRRRTLECKVDVPSRWSSKGVFLFPLLEHQYGVLQSRDNRVMRGLLLLPVQGRAETFKRVGTFSAFVYPTKYFVAVKQQEITII